MYSEGVGLSRPFRKVPSISAAKQSMGKTEASAVYRCTVLLGRLLFRRFFMSSRASLSMSSHCEYLSCKSFSCRQVETYQSKSRTGPMRHSIHKCTKCELSLRHTDLVSPDSLITLMFVYMGVRILPLILGSVGSLGRHSGAGSAPHSHG